MISITIREERVLDRVPTFEFAQEQTRATGAATELLLEQTGAQLWIQHNINGNAMLKKAPHYYD